MKQEKSCGAVVFRGKKKDPEILLIKHKNGGHWAFPKGHVEKNETEEDTALREIREETGLKVKLYTDFRTSVTFSPKEGVMKDVIYFGAKADKDKTKAQEEEVTDIRWFSPDEALKTITYENDRETLKSFLKYLEEKRLQKKLKKQEKE